MKLCLQLFLTLHRAKFAEQSLPKWTGLYSYPPSHGHTDEHICSFCYMCYMLQKANERETAPIMSLSLWKSHIMITMMIVLELNTAWSSTVVVHLSVFSPSVKKLKTIMQIQCSKLLLLTWEMHYT